jgi:hypothetical protein
MQALPRCCAEYGRAAWRIVGNFMHAERTATLSAVIWCGSALGGSGRTWHAATMFPARVVV